MFPFNPSIFALITTLMLFGNLTFGQNLVPNSGFENFTSCPTSSCQWSHATDWSNVNGATGCNNGNSGSPDYFNSCGGQFFNFPNTLNGQLNPYNGNAVMGIATWLGFTANFREYLGVQLTSALQAGEQYRLSFAFTNGNKVNNLSYGGHSTELGVHFSVGALTQNNRRPIILTPTIETVGGIFSTNWTVLNFTFTAPSNATHMTIGNFRNDNQSTITQEITPSSSFGYAFYYFDDVVVERITPLNASIISFEGKAVGSLVSLEANLVDDPSVEKYILSRLRTDGAFEEIFESNATFSFTDEQAGLGFNTYQLSPLFKDGTRGEGKLTEVYVDEVPEASIQLQQGNGGTRLSWRNIFSQVPFTLEVYGMDGKRYFSQSEIIPSGSFLRLAPLPTGCYIIRLLQEAEVQSWKKVIQ